MSYPPEMQHASNQPTPLSHSNHAPNEPPTKMQSVNCIRVPRTGNTIAMKASIPQHLRVVDLMRLAMADGRDQFVNVRYELWPQVMHNPLDYVDFFQIENMWFLMPVPPEQWDASVFKPNVHWLKNRLNAVQMASLHGAANVLQQSGLLPYQLFEPKANALRMLRNCAVEALPTGTRVYDAHNRMATPYAQLADVIEEEVDGLWRFLDKYVQESRAAN